MTIECPDCGNSFRGDKCKCGYKPSSLIARADVDRKWREMRHALDAQASVTDERWKAKAAILASVKETGPLRHLYQIVALDDAGLYLCPDIAKDARKRIAERVI